MDSDLDRHSPLTEILQCLLASHRSFTDNEYIYHENTAISLEEINVIINLLSHSNADAVEISDLMQALEYGDMA